MEKKYVVIDGNSIINRAFYGIRPLTAPDGTFTNALLGFLNIYNKLMADEKPDGVCVCFDRREPTFRHKAYDGYKATRKGMPEELAMQLPLLKEILDKMGVARLELAGFEADDLLGTLSKRIAANGDVCVLVTGDRDSLQLVGDNVLLRYVSTRMGKTDAILYDELKIRLDFDIEPIQFIEVKSLMGDTSDNIPGVKGVGEKTAFELIRRFETLDGVYANLGSPDIRPAVRTKLEAGRDTAYLSRMLAEIDRNAPVEMELSAMLPAPVDNDGLYTLLARLELRSQITKLKLKAPKYQQATEETAAFAPRKAADVPDMAVALAELKGDDPIAVYWNEDMTRAALSSAAGAVTAAIPGAEALAVLAGNGRTVYCHDAKALYRRCIELGIPAPRIGADTKLAAYLLNLPLEFPALAERFFAVSVSEPAPAAEQLSLFGGNESEDTLARNSELLLALVPVLSEKIREKDMEDLLVNVEMPLTEVIANMEAEGFRVDAAALAAFGRGMDDRVAALEAEICDLAGEKFNINSPKQLGVVLFEHLGLPALKKTHSGYSTNVDALAPLTHQFPIVARILEYRALTKLRSTYVDGLLKQVGPDGRIRSTFDQTGTVTGRLSSSEPNLQNIPVRQEPGSQLRQMFIARDGWKLVDADYSQIELRVLAHIAEDEAMRKAFADGEDFHTVTAARVFDVPVEEVTQTQRRRAKAVNFGIVYGISDFSLAEDIDSTRAEAKEIIEKYLERYPGVRAYRKQVVEEARENGYVSTLDHRRRYLPDIKASNFNVRTAAERIALNTPIQGTAADIIKRAMVLVFRRLRDEGLRARLILQVHDELIVEAPEDEAERVAALLSEEMERAADLSVRLIADSAIGFSWADTK